MGRRVVLVDDNSDMRMLLELQLTAGGCEVVGQAGNGAEAISVVDECVPDVVVMDMMMPVMDGIEATLEIKRRWPDMTVVGFTSLGHTKARDRMVKAGASQTFDKAHVQELIVALGCSGREAANA